MFLEEIILGGGGCFKKFICIFDFTLRISFCRLICFLLLIHSFIYSFLLKSIEIKQKVSVALVHIVEKKNSWKKSKSKTQFGALKAANTIHKRIYIEKHFAPHTTVSKLCIFITHKTQQNTHRIQPKKKCENFLFLVVFFLLSFFDFSSSSSSILSHAPPIVYIQIQTIYFFSPFFYL